MCTFLLKRLGIIRNFVVSNQCYRPLFIPHLSASRDEKYPQPAISYVHSAITISPIARRLVTKPLLGHVNYKKTPAPAQFSSSLRIFSAIF